MDYIWQQLKDGVIQTVATDHCPFFFEQKKLGKDNFAKIPNGGPGIETRMPIMLSEGPKHGLSLNKVVEVTLTKSILHENIDYTAFEGIKLNGSAIMTLYINDVISK